jgi:hypothetical protein
MRGAFQTNTVLFRPFRWSCRYETISDLMGLQDQIESFQKLVFSHFRHSVNNECRISSLVPLVKESWGIYRFITSMLRAMHRSTFVNPSFCSFSDGIVIWQEQMIMMHWNRCVNDTHLSITACANSTTNVQIWNTWRVWSMFRSWAKWVP